MKCPWCGVPFDFPVYYEFREVTEGTPADRFVWKAKARLDPACPHCRRRLYPEGGTP